MTTCLATGAVPTCMYCTRDTTVYRRMSKAYHMRCGAFMTTLREGRISITQSATKSVLKIAVYTCEKVFFSLGGCLANAHFMCLTAQVSCQARGQEIQDDATEAIAQQTRLRSDGEVEDSRGGWKVPR